MMKIESREDWLSKLKDLMEPEFNKHGYTYPDKIQVATSFCSTKKAVGQCFKPQGDKSETYNILIDPSKWYSMMVAEILCHELIHACLRNKGGHGVKFKEACVKLGLKPTKYTGATRDFVRWARPLIDSIGKYPHEKLERPKSRRVQVRLKIVRCRSCDFWVRIDEELLEGPRLKCPCCEDSILKHKDED